MMMVLIPFTGKCNYGEYGSIDDLKHIGIKFGFVEEYGAIDESAMNEV